jgi:hypothetical protein
MPTPVRIIIDIHDVGTFNWAGAFALWSANFKSTSMGFANDYGYVWYKVNPENNIPIIPLSENVRSRTIGMPPGRIQIIDNSAEIAELREEIDAVERAVYHAKSTKTLLPAKTKTAMQNGVKRLYSRWAALDADNIAMAAIATETITPVELSPDEVERMKKAERAAKARAARLERLERHRSAELARAAGSTIDVRDAMRAI